MLNLKVKGEPKVCDIGGVKFGGQPGDYPCVCVNSIFQKGDKVFEGKNAVKDLMSSGPPNYSKPRINSG